MTFAEAWDILGAADQVARAHGWECDPVIDKDSLCIELWRGNERRVVILAKERLAGCGGVEAVRELVEREVAKALVDRGAVA